VELEMEADGAVVIAVVKFILERQREWRYLSDAFRQNQETVVFRFGVPMYLDSVSQDTQTACEDRLTVLALVMSRIVDGEDEELERRLREVSSDENGVQQHDGSDSLVEWVEEWMNVLESGML
jgi:hypothetical protein